MSEDNALRRRPACHKSFRNSIFMGAPTRYRRAGYSELRSAAIQGGGQADQEGACRSFKGYYRGPRTSGHVTARRKAASVPQTPVLIYEMGFRERSRRGPGSVRPTVKPVPEKESFTGWSFKARSPERACGLKRQSVSSLRAFCWASDPCKPVVRSGQHVGDVGVGANPLTHVPCTARETHARVGGDKSLAPECRVS